MIQAHDNQLVKDCYLRVKAPTEDRYGFLSKDDENVEFQKLLHHISNTKSRYCAEENEAYVLGKKFRHLLRLRIEFNSSTPLALAVKASNDILVRKIVGYLKEEVADVDGVPVIDMVDEIGNTALHVAAMKGEVKIIKILVKGGANLLAENQYKMLPLHLGVEADDVRTIDTLLDCVGRFYERYEKEITGEAPFWLKNGENRSSYPAIRAKSKADVEEIFQSTSIEATHDDIVKNAQKAEKKEIKIKQILKRGIRDCWEEYQVLWNDDKHKTTWHNRKVIEKLLGNDQSLLEDFDNQLDGVIRLYLNQPNRYGKSSFMGT